METEINNAGSTCQKLWNLSISTVFCQKVPKYDQLYNYGTPAAHPIINSSWKIPVLLIEILVANAALAFTQLMQTHEIYSLSQFSYLSKVVFTFSCQVDRNMFSLHLYLFMLALLPLLLVLASSECFSLQRLSTFRSSPFCLSVVRVQLAHRVVALGSLWLRPDENNSRCWFSRVTWAAVASFTYHLCLFEVQYELSKSECAFSFLFLAHHRCPLFFYSLLIPAYWLAGQSDTMRCLSSVWPVWASIPYCSEK